MNKSLEALIADMKAAAHEEIMCRESCDTSDRWNDEVSPENVLALIAALEQAQKSNSFLKEQLSQLANFNQDWDKLEACQESWREVSAELKAAQQKIEELESLCVNPASAMRGAEPLCVKLQPELWEIKNPGEGSYYSPNEPNEVDYKFNLVAERFYSESQLRAAGVTVGGGE